MEVKTGISVHYAYGIKIKHLNILTYVQILPTIGLTMTVHKIEMSVSRNQHSYLRVTY